MKTLKINVFFAGLIGQLFNVLNSQNTPLFSFFSKSHFYLEHDGDKEAANLQNFDRMACFYQKNDILTVYKGHQLMQAGKFHSEPVS